MLSDRGGSITDCCCQSVGRSSGRVHEKLRLLAELIRQLPTRLGSVRGLLCPEKIHDPQTVRLLRSSVQQPAQKVVTRDRCSSAEP